MARCKSCSAPLPANSNRCIYCAIRNDVDLQGKYAFSVSNVQSERLCPRCDTPMQTISLKTGGNLYIERCDLCFGLFFDPGEMQILLENTVTGVFDINLQQLVNINKDRFQTQKEIKYVKCPVCQVLMNRVNFGRRSGVIIDQCKQHGIWLDSGEITHLMEWKKAGGQLLHQQHGQQKVNKSKSGQMSDGKQRNGYFDNLSKESDLFPDDLADLVSNVIFKLFD